MGSINDWDLSRNNREMTWKMGMRPNGSFIVRLLWIQNLDRGDGLVRPKLSYELRSNVLVWIGFDGFYGSRNGLFGEFDQHSRVVFGIEWGIGT